MTWRILVLFAFSIVVLAGCAGLRLHGEPITAPEIGSVLAVLDDAGSVRSAFRATGEARLTLSGRTLKTTFVAVYERPGWLRADLRPSYGSLGSSLTAEALLEDGCARIYFPARLMEVTGCLSDLAAGTSVLDPAALVLGLPDAGLATGLKDLTGRREGATVFLTGTAGEAYVTVEIDERIPAVTRVVISGREPDQKLTVSYEGYGWKERVNVPETVSLSAFEGTTHEIGVEIIYKTARPLSSVDRTAHGLFVPPGAMQVDWRNLGIWR